MGSGVKYITQSSRMQRITCCYICWVVEQRAAVFSLKLGLPDGFVCGALPNNKHAFPLRVDTANLSHTDISVHSAARRRFLSSSP
jgi:hypothetical protein